MVRIRYPDSVKIQITGVKSIIPTPRVEIGRRSMTWLTFLNDVCGVQLDSIKDYFICTSGYFTNNSVAGWTAGLNDPIDQFVTKFTKKLRKYCVRLHNGRQPTQIGTDFSTGNNKVKSKPKISSSALPASPLTSSPIAKLAKTLVARKFASIVPMKPSQLAKMSVNNINRKLNDGVEKNISENLVTEPTATKSTLTSDLLVNNDEQPIMLDNFNDDMVMCNTEEMVGLKPTKHNLEVNNLVDRFEQQIDELDDSMLQQICQEIQKLKRSELWERNAKRSPLACSLLWEVCKE